MDNGSIEIEIICAHCGSIFKRAQRQVKESAKLGHNSYCTLKCQYKYKTKAELLVCENSLCGKKFQRAPNDISLHNYCSSSCAAIVNNEKYPKWPEKKCLYRMCKKMHRRTGSQYCSIECAKASKFTYTDNEIVLKIQDFHKLHKRVPAKRDMPELTGCAVHVFGSWNNAITTAGLTPHRSDDHRMYKRTITKARDGHRCDSISEAIIDNWLTRNDVQHERDVSYPKTNHKADWKLTNERIFVEYFGLAKDSPRYDRSIEEKKELCRQHRIRLIEIYPQDLYPKIRLEDKLGAVLAVK